MRILAPIALAATLLAAGCASSDDMQKIQSQISDLQDQVAALKRSASSKEEVQNVNAKVADQTQTLLKSNAALAVKVDQIEERMQSTSGAVEQTNHRLDRIVQQLTQAQHDIEELRAAENGRPVAPPAAAPIPVTTQPVTQPAITGTPATSQLTVPATPAPRSSGEDQVLTYQSAYRDYQRGHYDLAINGFKDFLAKNGSSDLAVNAQYWIGECLYSQKKYREAIEQFDTVVTKYPRSDKVAGALLKKGYAYLAVGEKAQGIVQLQYVVHEHPSSPETALARQRLKQLGVETK
jgi:tol-pal system protein YbgF